MLLDLRHPGTRCQPYTARDVGKIPTSSSPQRPLLASAILLMAIDAASSPMSTLFPDCASHLFPFSPPRRFSDM